MKKYMIYLLISCLLLGALAGCQTVETPPQTQNGASREEYTVQPVTAGDAVLKTNALTLLVGQDPNQLQLQHHQSGYTYTTAIGAEESETVKGVMRLKLQSLVTGSYYDLQLKKKTDFYSANQEIKSSWQLLQGKNESILQIQFSLENGLAFTVQVQLEENRLLIRIPQAGLVETDRFVFKQLQLAPNLLSATAQQAGYFLLPDGSGSLMYFHNGKKGVYDEAVYGVNKAFVYDAYAVSEQNIHLPVFGMYADGSTALGIVSSGAACAQIFAATNGNETTRNRAYPSFLLRQEDTQYITQDAFQTVIEETNHLSEDLEVTYVFGQPQGGYSEMARLLRQYLDWKVSAPEGCVLVSIYGAVEEKQKVLGVPLYDKAGQITSYDGARQMVSQIAQWTQTTPAIRLASWNTATVTGYAADSFDPVGSEKQFQQLVQFCEDAGMKVYLSESFATVRKSGNGIHLKRDVIRNLANELSRQYSYYRASNSANESLPAWYYLDGSVVQQRTASFAEALGKDRVVAVAVEDISRLNYANYRKNASCGQDATVKAFCDALCTLQEQYDLMVSGGYGYSLPYAEFVYDAPVSDSGFVCTDGQVPFYQMVLSGRCAYALPAVNRQENRKLVWLKAMETGAWIHYELAEETAYLQSTGLEDLYGAKWTLTAQTIRQELETYEKDLACVAGSTIVLHEMPDENITRTYFENGWVVTVNYGMEPVTVDGAVVQPQSYRLERGTAE